MDVVGRIAAFVRLNHLFSLEQPVLVAVSGGADSLCLLDALHRLGYRLVVAHFDHGWRTGSAEDLRFVERLAAGYGLPFAGGSAEPGALNRRHGESLEAVSRQARYEFLLRVAIGKRIKWVATGHTATDQAETVLMNLIRGAGVRGLGGMRPATSMAEWETEGPGASVMLGRPLLGIGRDATEAYCAERGLTPRQDPSNQDLSHLRNRIRLEVLPLLRGENPSIETALCRTADVLAAVSDLIEGAAAEAWRTAVPGEKPREVTLDAAVLEELPLALQREVVRRAFQALDVPLREGGFEAVEAVLGRLDPEGPGARMLPGGITQSRSRGKITLRDPRGIDSTEGHPQLVEGLAVDLTGEGLYRLESGWHLRVERVARDDMESKDPSWRASVWIEVFDAAGGLEGMVLRPPERGDRLQPFGMAGTSKISDLFTDAKVPRAARRRWPILVENGELLWVPGVRRGQGRPIGPETAEVFRLELACEEFHK